MSPQKTHKDPKGRVVLDDTAAVVINTMGETTSLTTREALQDAIDESKPRPRPNLDAESQADVYRVQELAGNDILLRLNIKSLRNAVKNKQDVLTTSRYFSNRLNKVVLEGKDDSLRALRFLLVLVEWKKTFKPGRKGETWMLAKDAETESLITDYDSILMTKIKRKFTPQK